VTEHERMTFEVLDTIDRREPVTLDEMVAELRERLVAAGVLQTSAKVDRVWVGRDVLARLERHEPPLVVSEIPHEQVDGYGRPLPGAAEAFTLTSAGDHERERLERLLPR
jgi:hypothetical protein